MPAVCYNSGMSTWTPPRPCVGAAWRKGRHVRIIDPAYGYGGKVGTIMRVGERYVYVRIKTGRTIWDWDEVAYTPGCLKLI